MARTFSALMASAILTTALTVVFSGQTASAAAAGGAFGGGGRFSAGSVAPFGGGGAALGGGGAALGGGGPALGGGGPALGGGPIPGGGTAFGNGVRVLANPLVTGGAFGNAPPLISNTVANNSGFLNARFANQFFGGFGGGVVPSGFFSSGFMAPGGFVSSGFASPFMFGPSVMTPIIPGQMLGPMQLQVNDPFAETTVVGQRQMFVNGMPQTISAGSLVTNYRWPAKRSFARTIRTAVKKHTKRHHGSACTHPKTNIVK